MNARFHSAKWIFAAAVVAALAFAIAPSSAAEGVTEFTVRSYDGVRLPAAYRRPAGEGPFPAVFILHGGLGGGSPRGAANLTLGLVQDHFLERGYVVMGSEYRRYHFGEDEIQDMLAGYRALQQLDFVDADRIALIGGSHGGYLALMLATRVRPAAVVSFAGLVDIEDMFYDHAQQLRRRYATFDEGWQALVGMAGARPAGGGNQRAPTDYDPGEERPVPPFGTPAFEVSLELGLRAGDDRQRYRDIAPKQNAEKIASPVLYVVGGRDYLRGAGRELIEALKARGAAAEYSEHAGVGHGFYWGGGDNGRTPQFEASLAVTTAFVERYTRAKD